MRKFLLIFIAAAFLGAGGFVIPVTEAQNRPDRISGALLRLKNNPRYQGSVLGTHVVPGGRDYLYEVRILRPNDTIILVYIDPETGGVVGDSERQRIKPSRDPERRPPGWRRPRRRGDRGRRQEAISGRRR